MWCATQINQQIYIVHKKKRNVDTCKERPARGDNFGGRTGKTESIWIPNSVSYVNLEDSYANPCSMA